MKPHLLVVVGARPNYVKTAPVIHALLARGTVEVSVLNSGQHYDHNLAGAFLERLQFPRVAHSLNVGSGTHAEQTAGVLLGVEQILAENDFDAVLVPGDVNSTMAAALAAAKFGIRVIHLEAGLRSGDWSMPEEINRVVTDRLSDLLLCHSEEAVANLGSEGIDEERIALVGNTMIDSLLKLLPAARDRGVLERLELRPKEYALGTLHRPALVDEPERLAEVLMVLAELTERLAVVVPLHPRTRARLKAEHSPALERLILLEPLDYLDFIALEEAARLVVTDSGGVQEETSALGVPCVTYRTTTERRVTLTHGTNRLVALDAAELDRTCHELLDAPADGRRSPIPLWDGKAGERAAVSIEGSLSRWRASVRPRPSAGRGLRPAE